MKISRLLQTLPLMALVLVLNGCQNPLRREASTTLGVTGPVTINLESFGGDVIIHADPKYSSASIHFVMEAVHGPGREHEAALSLDEITYSARLVPGDLGQILVIRAATTHPEPYFQRVHITIDLPAVDGLRIITANGKVYAQGVAGETNIRTTNGDVRLMTNLAMTREVRITNVHGDIDYRVRGESRGNFNCVAVDGKVLHRVRFGAFVVHAGTDQDTLRATLNGGDNPIILSTSNGDIRIAVVDEPEKVGLLIFEP